MPFAGLFEGGDGADISGERAAAAEVGGVADRGDDAGRGLGADAVDGGEQPADLVLAQSAVEIAVELAQAAAQDVEVIAGVADLQAIGGAVVLSDGAAGGVAEQARQVQADVMAAVVAQGRQTAHRHPAEGRGGGIVAQDGAGQFAVEGAHVAGELGKAEIDQAVQLPHAIAEILQQARAQLRRARAIPR